jgi:uncharacterized protein
MTASRESVPVDAIGVGIDRSQDWRLNFVPDLEGVDLGMVDFAQVRSELGLGADEPLHVLSDLDMTLRHSHAPEINDYIATNIQAQLANGRITSFHIATNNRDPDVMLFGEQISPKTLVFAPAPSESGRLVRKQEAEYYKRIVGALGVEGQAVLAVGDKYRRDVLGGNRAGVYTMHVMPLLGPDLWFDRLGLRAFDNYAGQLGRRALHALTR